jgi:hypothetical protein
MKIRRPWKGFNKTGRALLLKQSLRKSAQLRMTANYYQHPRGVRSSPTLEGFTEGGAGRMTKIYPQAIDQPFHRKLIQAEEEGISKIQLASRASPISYANTQRRITRPISFWRQEFRRIV